MELSRRGLFKAGALGGLGVAAFTVPLGGTLSGKEASELSSSQFPRPYTAAFRQPPVLQPYGSATTADGKTVPKYEVAEKVGSAGIIRGAATPVLGYNGIFPGPTVSVERGTPIQMRVRNQLPLVHPQWGYRMDTSTHLHGSASLPEFDGYANDVTFPGFKKYYQYPNFQPARTLWYHDHAVHHTAQNAYSGLAGLYIIHDADERRLLPQGEYDVPLAINDVMFDSSGKLAYDDNSTSGLWGDVILVNGVPWPNMKVKKAVYRFRILNCSISRSFRFQLSNRAPVTVVATDGGLMPAAKQVTQWRHGGAERYEVLIDFRKYATGTKIELRNLSNDNNVDYDHTYKVMRFEVTADPVDEAATKYVIPTTLVPSEVMSMTASQAKTTRHFRVKKDSSGVWTFGDQSWEEIVQSGFTKVLANPGLNDVEIWEIENSSGGWFHPVHIHLVDFQILSRNGRPPFEYEKGPKDVVYVGEGETVKLLMKFGPHEGRYMVHCHNLPHEDHDMMSQFAVGSPDGKDASHDPIEAAPCVEDSDDD